MAEYSPAKNFIDNASSPSYLAYICKRAGVKLNDIRRYMTWDEDDDGPYDGPVAEEDLVWALGFVALADAGYEPSEANADRVSFVEPAEHEGPTEAQ